MHGIAVGVDLIHGEDERRATPKHIRARPDQGVRSPGVVAEEGLEPPTRGL